ncbi:hypothetical protein ACOSQ2_016127 [Xanthoceras sorbifolium]
MGEKKKVTFMLLKVDLQCCKCYKKVKKILCQFPQIHDQVYDEKNNTVTIKVVCCSPEKIRDKICCKGRGCIKSIEILKPPPPKPDKPPPPKSPEKPPPPKSPEKPPPPKSPEKPPPPKVTCEQPPQPKPPQQPPQLPIPCYPPVPGRTCCSDCYEGRSGGPCYSNDQCYGRPPVPRRTCCSDCYEGRSGGPCYSNDQCYGQPQVPRRSCCSDCYEGRSGGPCYSNDLPSGQPVRYYDGYCGRPVYDSWGGGGGYRAYRGSRCCEYLSEENPQGCTIM